MWDEMKVVADKLFSSLMKICDLEERLVYNEVDRSNLIEDNWIAWSMSLVFEDVHDIHDHEFLMMEALLMVQKTKLKMMKPDLKIDLLNDLDSTKLNVMKTRKDEPLGRSSSLFVVVAVGQDDDIDDQEHKFLRRISPMVVGLMIEMR